MDWQISNYGKRFIDIYEEFPVSLGPDTTGFRTVFEWNGELGIKEGWTGVLRGRQDFIIRAYGTSTDFDRLRDTLDEIIGTFTLIPPDATQAASDDIFVLLSEEPDTLDPALHAGPVTGPLNALFGGLVRHRQRHERNTRHRAGLERFGGRQSLYLQPSLRRVLPQRRLGHDRGRGLLVGAGDRSRNRVSHGAACTSAT